jgi:hypothetical protein
MVLGVGVTLTSSCFENNVGGVIDDIVGVLPKRPLAAEATGGFDLPLLKSEFDTGALLFELGVLDRLPPKRLPPELEVGTVVACPEVPAGGLFAAYPPKVKPFATGAPPKREPLLGEASVLGAVAPKRLPAGLGTPVAV